jgi:hypothetical protein
MPPHSKSLIEEGASFKSFYLVKRGVFNESELVQALKAPGMVPGSSGTRNLQDNLSDLKAQIAANHKVLTIVCRSHKLLLIVLSSVFPFLCGYSNNQACPSILLILKLILLLNFHPCSSFLLHDVFPNLMFWFWSHLHLGHFIFLLMFRLSLIFSLYLFLKYTLKGKKEKK